MNYSTPISVSELKNLIQQLEQAEYCIAEILKSGGTSDPRLVEYQVKKREIQESSSRKMKP